MCSLESAHYVLMLCSYPFCIVHCYSTRVYSTLLLMAILWVVWLCPIFFVRDLRLALQQHAAAQGLTTDGHAVSAIKRGAALLSAMSFLLTETAACLGGDTSTAHHRNNCPEAVINLTAAQQLTHIYLFELIICDTGIASHADLLRCNRLCQACPQGHRLWLHRHVDVGRTPLDPAVRFEPPDWAGDPSMNVGAMVLVGGPSIMWTPCVTMPFAA